MIVGVSHPVNILNLPVDPDQLAAILAFLSRSNTFRLASKTEADQYRFDYRCGRILLDIFWSYRDCCLVHREPEGGIG